MALEIKEFVGHVPTKAQTDSSTKKVVDKNTKKKVVKTK